MQGSRTGRTACASRSALFSTISSVPHRQNAPSASTPASTLRLRNASFILRRLTQAPVNESRYMTNADINGAAACMHG